jgi:hypothetical protein
MVLPKVERALGGNALLLKEITLEGISVTNL